MLNVIADFTDLNIITSDTVTGNITLRLKDVPWDQALEIILQTRGLDSRKHGNVIWIAPRDELATREKLALEAQQQINDLEPTRTETFQMNYQKAADVQKLLSDPTQRDPLQARQRGGRRAHQHAVRAGHAEPARGGAEADRQDRRAGAPGDDRGAHRRGERHASARTSARASAITDARRPAHRHPPPGSIARRPRRRQPGRHRRARRAGAPTRHAGFIPDSLNVNLPAAGLNAFNAGRVLLHPVQQRALTRFLNLEICALEADGKGKIISSPRVLTADQVEALIEQGTEIPYQQATSSGATAVSFRKANLSLKVKPQITPDGNVIMTLDVNKDQPRRQPRRPACRSTPSTSRPRCWSRTAARW